MLRRHHVFRLTAVKTQGGVPLYEREAQTVVLERKNMVCDCCSYRWPCLKHVEEQNYIECLLERACGACTCMCMNHLDFAVIRSQLIACKCQWLLLFAAKSVLLMTGCLDPGSGMHLVICPIAVHGLPLHWYVLKPHLRVVSVR